MFDQVNKKINNETINGYAINVNVHLKNREEIYLRPKSEFRKIVNQLSKTLALQANVSISTPILD